MTVCALRLEPRCVIRHSAKTNEADGLEERRSDVKQREEGERVLIDTRIATIVSSPAKSDGMQTVRFDGIDGLPDFAWVPWQVLAQLPDAPEQVQP